MLTAPWFSSHNEQKGKLSNNKPRQGIPWDYINYCANRQRGPLSSPVDVLGAGAATHTCSGFPWGQSLLK